MFIVRNQVSPTIDPDDGSEPIAAVTGWWQARVIGAFVLPLVLFVVLRPERYGLTPNELDPFFYTGYAINFDDIFREVADQRYFTSRWSIYLPGRLFSEVFGAVWGRLLLRWITTAGVLLSLWHLGRQWKWSKTTELIVGVIAVTTPMFARAILTDYVEWLVVALGIILLCQCLEEQTTLIRSAMIGTLAALIVIANPVAVTVTVVPLGFVLVNHYWTARDLRRTALHAAVLFGAGCLTVIAGFLVFRYLYDLPNVYRPTLQFMREYRGVRDPLKSPNLDWVGDFTWLFVPPLVIGGALVVPASRRLVRTNRYAAAAVLFLTVQYVIQWLDQFVRDGVGLEISYYWVLTLPALTMVTAVFIGPLGYSWRTGTALLVGWFALLVQPWPVNFDLPGDWWIPVVGTVVVGGAFLLGRGHPAGAGALVVLTALAWQVAAPKYDPSSYFFFNASPLYDEIYFNAGSFSDRQLTEAIWLEEELDTLASDDGITFIAQGPADNIIGIYGPHVTGKRMLVGPDGLPTADAIAWIGAGSVALLAVYGPDDFVTSTLGALTDANIDYSEVLDRRHTSGLQYRLAVLEVAPPDYEDVTWPATALPAQTGANEDGVRTAVPGRDAPGYLLIGPAADLEDGAYRATLEFSGSVVDAPGEIAAFDVARDGASIARSSIQAPIAGTTEVSLDFIVDTTGSWDFRVTWFGAEAIGLHTVRLQRLG